MGLVLQLQPHPHGFPGIDAVGRVGDQFGAYLLGLDDRGRRSFTQRIKRKSGVCARQMGASSYKKNSVSQWMGSQGAVQKRAQPRGQQSAAGGAGGRKWGHKHVIVGAGASVKVPGAKKMPTGVGMHGFGKSLKLEAGAKGEDVGVARECGAARGFFVVPVHVVAGLYVDVLVDHGA